MIADAATGEGFTTCDSVAVLPEKCRALLKQAVFKTTAVKTAVVGSDSIKEAKGIAFTPSGQVVLAAHELKSRFQRAIV
jgi:hypothetical protein